MQDFWTVRAYWVEMMLFTVVGHKVRGARVYEQIVMQINYTNLLYKFIIQINYTVCLYYRVCQKKVDSK